MGAWDLSNLSTDQLETLLWATFIFHLRHQFQHVSLTLAKALTADEWKAWEVHPIPPPLLKGTVRKGYLFVLSILNIPVDDMRELYERLKNQVQQLIETVIDEVVASDNRHSGKPDKRCGECFRNKPRATKKCGNCGSSDFQDYLCTKDTRLALFKEWLQSQLGLDDQDQMFGRTRRPICWVHELTMAYNGILERKRPNPTETSD
jgi:hypothetical protein